MLLSAQDTAVLELLLISLAVSKKVLNLIEVLGASKREILGQC
jgi:hypothetical protein